MKIKSNTFTTDNQYQALEMGLIRRSLWYFTNRLGLDFALSLLLSLFYQLFVALFIALRGMSNLPIIHSLYNSGLAAQILAVVISVVLSLLIQGLVVAEMAQVVWLRYPERLNIRLMSKSVWWSIITIALIITLVFDFSLLFMATTEQNNIFQAFSFMITGNQFTGVLVFLLSLLNFLTILRCASVMRTTTVENTGRNLQEYLVGIAQDTLVSASDTVHRQTALLWKSLGVPPDRLIPLHNSVIDFVVATHADKLPQQLPGSAWSYDWKGNRLVMVPPEVHAALLQNTEQFSQPQLPGADTNKSGGTAHNRPNGSTTNQVPNPSDVFWKMGARQQSELINLNLETLGRPDVVDATDPNHIRYLNPKLYNPQTNLNTKQVNAKTVEEKKPDPSESKNGQSKAGAAKPQPASKPNTTLSKLPQRLSSQEKALFEKYLVEVYEQEYDEEFDLENDSIFEQFEPEELEEFYAQWKEEGQNSPNDEDDPWQE